MSREIADPNIDSEVAPIFDALSDDEKLRLAEKALAKQAKAKAKANAYNTRNRDRNIRAARLSRATLRLAVEWYTAKKKRDADEARASKRGQAE